jgi:SAM-dependent methyltransferase
MADAWDDKCAYLRATRSLYHNVDYWAFLVKSVWRLHERSCQVVDFGCGYGWAELMLLPLLSPGSVYRGVDQSEKLLAEAREVFADSPFRERAEFVLADATAVPFPDDSFDVAFAHTLLMHLTEPEAALREMIRVTRSGGLVITCDANRNAGAAMLHIEEVGEQDCAALSAFQTMNARLRRDTGRDCNIGMKTPVLMHKAGLQDVQARLSDAVRLLFPPVDSEEKENLFRSLCDDGLGWNSGDPAAVAERRNRLVSLGVPESEAGWEIDRERDNDFLHLGRGYHTVCPGLLTFSFGTVKK